ncbi:hypothetical protein HK405_011207, partial [Cladochytrium tenue]
AASAVDRPDAAAPALRRAAPATTSTPVASALVLVWDLALPVRLAATAVATPLVAARLAASGWDRWLRAAAVRATWCTGGHHAECRGRQDLDDGGWGRERKVLDASLLVLNLARI